jgi:hypothetical protein
MVGRDAISDKMTDLGELNRHKDQQMLSLPSYKQESHDEATRK